MVTPTEEDRKLQEEVRKLMGEIDTLMKEADGTYTSELGEKLNSRARRISMIVKEVKKMKKDNNIPNLRRGAVFVTPNNEYYRNKNLGFGWAIQEETETEITWGEVSMMQKNFRINTDDTVQDMIIKLSEGNPDALTVCTDIFESGDLIDPDRFLGGMGLLILFDSLSLYGSQILMLYKDVCEENMVEIVAILRAFELGFVSEDKLKHAINNHGDGIDKDDLFKQVKNRLPNFDSVTKPEEVIEEVIRYPVEEVDE